MSICVLATGAELLDGRVADTNTRHIASRLAEHGLTLRHAVSCGDAIEEIHASLRFLLTRASYIVMTGGLGPTTDDLSREALAALLGEKLCLHEDVLATLHELYRARRRTFDPSNTKQATFPESATVIPNPVGTAAGFRVLLGAVPVAVLPGVPHELRRLFEDSVLPDILASHQGAAPLRQRALRVFGLPESVVGARVGGAVLPPGIEVGYRASFPEIQVTLKSRDPRADLDRALATAREAIGPDCVYSEDLTVPMEQTVLDLLVRQGWHLAVAESCTGGLIGSLLTRIPGSSRCFPGGVITYANEAKTRELGVSPATLATVGAVSRETALAMAAGARTRWQTECALAVTGIAGPDGGSPEKPVGTFYVGLATPDSVEAWLFFLSAGRDNVRSFAAMTALDVLRRHLLNLPIRGNVP